MLYVWREARAPTRRQQAMADLCTHDYSLRRKKEKKSTYIRFHHVYMLFYSYLSLIDKNVILHVSIYAPIIRLFYSIYSLHYIYGRDYDETVAISTLYSTCIFSSYRIFS